MNWKCVVCGKPAVHHITRITPQGLISVHLCQEHHQQFGHIGADFPIGEGETGATSRQESESTGDLTCGSCGQTFRQFRETSKFGCADCYEYFDANLEPLLERLHKAVRHEGKLPRGGAARAKLRREIQQLRRDKESAVNREDFEAAARIRDRIRQLQGADDE